MLTMDFKIHEISSDIQFFSISVKPVTAELFQLVILGHVEEELVHPHFSKLYLMMN